MNNVNYFKTFNFHNTSIPETNSFEEESFRREVELDNKHMNNVSLFI